MSSPALIYACQTTLLPAGVEDNCVLFSAYFSPRIYADVDSDTAVSYEAAKFPNWTSSTANLSLILTWYSQDNPPTESGFMLLDESYERDPYFRHKRCYHDIWANVFSDSINCQPYRLKHEPDWVPEVYDQRQQLASVLQHGSVAVYPSAAGELSQEIIRYFTANALGHGGCKGGKFIQAGEEVDAVPDPLGTVTLLPQKGYQDPPKPALSSIVSDEATPLTGGSVPKNYGAKSDPNRQKPEFHALLGHLMETPVLAHRLGLLRHYRVPLPAFEEALYGNRGIPKQMRMCLTLASPPFQVVQPIVLTKCVFNRTTAQSWDGFSAMPDDSAHVGGCLKLDQYALSPIDPTTSATSLVATSTDMHEPSVPLFRSTGLYLIRLPETEDQIQNDDLKLGATISGLKNGDSNLDLVANNIYRSAATALSSTDGTPPSKSHIDLSLVPQVGQEELIRGYAVDIAFAEADNYIWAYKPDTHGGKPPALIPVNRPPDPFPGPPEWFSLCARGVTVSDPDLNFQDNFDDEGHISLHAQIAPAPMHGWLTPYPSPLEIEPNQVTPTRNWYVLWTATAAYLLYEWYPELDPATDLPKSNQSGTLCRVPENLRDGSYVCVNVRLPSEWLSNDNLGDVDDYSRAYEIVSLRRLTQASLFGSIVSLTTEEPRTDRSRRCLISVQTSLENPMPRFGSASVILPPPDPDHPDDYTRYTDPNNPTWIMAAGNYGLRSDSPTPTYLLETEATFEDRHDDKSDVLAVRVPFLDDPILVRSLNGARLSLNKSDPVWLVIPSPPLEGSDIYPNVSVGVIEVKSCRLAQTDSVGADPINFGEGKITLLIDGTATVISFSKTCIYEDELNRPFGVSDPAEAGIPAFVLTSELRPAAGDSVIAHWHAGPDGQPLIHQLVYDPDCAIGIIDEMPTSEDFIILKSCVPGSGGVILNQETTKIFLEDESVLSGDPELIGHRMPPRNVLLAAFYRVIQPPVRGGEIRRVATKIEVFAPNEAGRPPSPVIFRWVVSSTQDKVESRLQLNLKSRPAVHRAARNNPEAIHEQLVLNTRPRLLPDGLTLSGKRVAICVNSEASPQINMPESEFKPPSIYALQVLLIGVLERDQSGANLFRLTLEEDQEDSRWRSVHMKVSETDITLTQLTYVGEADIFSFAGHVVAAQVLFELSSDGSPMAKILSIDLNRRTVFGRVRSVDTDVYIDTLDGRLEIVGLHLPQLSLSRGQLIVVTGEVMLIEDEIPQLVFAPKFLEKVGDLTLAGPPATNPPRYTPSVFRGMSYVGSTPPTASAGWFQYIFVGSAIPDGSVPPNGAYIFWNHSNLCTPNTSEKNSAIAAQKIRYPTFLVSPPSPVSLPLPKAQFLYVDTTVFKFQNNNLIVSPNSLDSGRTNAWDDSPAPSQTSLKLRIDFRLPADTVLPLRFGRRYQVRMRMVDLGGNRPAVPRDMKGDLALCVVATHQPYMRFDPVLPPQLTDVHTASPQREQSKAGTVLGGDAKKKAARPAPSVTPRVNTQLYTEDNAPPRYVPDDLLAIVQPVDLASRPVSQAVIEREGPPNNTRGFGSKSERFIALPVEYEKPLHVTTVTYPTEMTKVVLEAHWNLEPPGMDLRLAEMTGEIDRLVANVGDPCSTLEDHTMVESPPPPTDAEISKLWPRTGRAYLPDTYSSGVAVRAIRGPLSGNIQLFSPRRLPPDVRSKLRELHNEFAVFDYAGEWPKTPHVPCILQPSPLVLDHQRTCTGKLTAWLEPFDDNRLVFSLPVGEVADIEISSFLVERNLERMAAYLLLRDSETSWMVPTNQGLGPCFDFLKGFCLLGLHRTITPSRLLRLIHAVHTPNEYPEVNWIKPAVARSFNGINQAVRLQVRVHRNSTGIVALHSTYQIYEDSLDADQPNIPVAEAKEMILHEESLSKINQTDWWTLSTSMETLMQPPPSAAEELPEDLNTGVKTVILERPLPLWDNSQETLTATQSFPNTKHYRIYVRAEARTRFQEYFPADQCESKYSHRFGVLDVPASTVPTPPVFAYSQPLFSWTQNTAPNSITRTRSGYAMRLFLHRPWFSSGRDEMLAVIFRGVEGRPHSRITCDPLWNPLQPAHPLPTSLDPTFNSNPIYDRDGGGAWVFTPFYCCERKLWFVDFIFSGDSDSLSVTYGRTPFVQLALARFQPCAIPGCNFSKAIRTDFISLLPPRRLTLTRQGNKLSLDWSPGADPSALPTVLTGAPQGVNVTLTLEMRRKNLITELGWTNVLWQSTAPYVLPRLSPEYDYQVVVRETESFPYFANDPAANFPDVTGSNNDMRQRLTYLDIFPLPEAS